MRLTFERNGAWLALLAACAAVFLTALDQTVVVTVLPGIIVDLQIPVGQLDRAAWIVSAYLLGYVIAMPLMGYVSDIYGRQRIFLLCLGIFASGSLFCGLAPVIGNSDTGMQFIALLPPLFLEGRKPLRTPIRSTDSDMIMNVERV